MARPLIVFTASLAAVVGLAYVAQNSFDRQTTDALPITGIVSLLAATALLNTLVFVTDPRMRSSRFGRWLSGLLQHLRGVSRQVIFALLSALACITATVWGTMPDRGWPSFWAWLVGIACAALALRNGRHQVQLRSWLATYRLEVGLVVACMLVALVARSYGLSGAPPVLDGDEAEMGVEAQSILHGDTTQFFVTGWLGMPRMSFLVMGLPMRIWGENIFALRLHSAIIGTATIPMLYALLRPEIGLWIAQLSIWLLATLPFHIHFSRLGANNIEDSLILTGTFASLLWGIRSRQPPGWALAGLFAAMSLYFYPGARAVVVLLLGFIAAMLLRTRWQWARHYGGGLGLMSAMFMVAGLPMLWFYTTHWTEFAARMQTVGLIQSGRLREQMQETGHSPFAILWTQFLRSFFSYGFYRDHTFYNDSEPMLQFWAAVLFPLGVAISLLYYRQRLFLVLLIWLFGLVIMGGALTIDPPYYARLTGLAPVLTTMVALALVTLARLGTHFKLCDQRMAVAITILIVTCLGFNGIRHYFVDYVPAYRYSSINAELGTEAGKYLGRLSPDNHVYFLGRPRMYLNFGNFRFLAPRIQGSDMPNPISGLPPDYDRTRPAFFLSIPERMEELRQIQRLLPGGKWQQVNRVHNDRPLFYSYQVEPLAQASDPGQ